MGLCRLFNPSEQAAPTVVLRLIQEVELRAAATPSLDLYRLYRTTPGAVDELRSQLCEGIFVVECRTLFFSALLTAFFFRAGC